MDSFDLKKYLTEGKLLKEIKVNDPVEFRKHGPMIDIRSNKPLATFLDYALSGMDEGEIKQQVRRDEWVEMFDEDSKAVEAFDYVYNSLKNNKLTKFTEEDGADGDGWIYYYQLSILDEDDPTIRIISNVEEK